MELNFWSFFLSFYAIKIIDTIYIKSFITVFHTMKIFQKKYLVLEYTNIEFMTSRGSIKCVMKKNWTSPWKLYCACFGEWSFFVCVYWNRIISNFTKTWFTLEKWSVVIRSYFTGNSALNKIKYKAPKNHVKSNFF